MPALPARFGAGRVWVDVGLLAWEVRVGVGVVWLRLRMRKVVAAAVAIPSSRALDRHSSASPTATLLGAPVAPPRASLTVIGPESWSGGACGGVCPAGPGLLASPILSPVCQSWSSTRVAPGGRAAAGVGLQDAAWPVSGSERGTMCAQSGSSPAGDTTKLGAGCECGCRAGAGAAAWNATVVGAGAGRCCSALSCLTLANVRTCGSTGISGMSRIALHRGRSEGLQTSWTILRRVGTPEVAKIASCTSSEDRCHSLDRRNAPLRGNIRTSSGSGTGRA